MAYIAEIPNAMDPLVGARQHTHAGGISIRDWVKTEKGFHEFPIPTICVRNGQPVMRDQWTDIIQKEDVITFVAVPQGLLLIFVVIIAVLAAATLLLAPKITTPGEGPKSDPVFSTKGQNNAIRLGEPIEVCYGRNRVFPSLASRPYYEYIDNDQFQYSLLCVGHGYFEIDEIRIGDTSIANYQEVEWQVIEPGQAVTLFPTNVISSVEAGGQTLIASNEETYVAPGWVGPFPANPSTTEVKQIQVDVIFPRGLYALTDDGGVLDIGVQIEIQARLINDAGTAIGPFFDLPDPSPVEIAAATVTPQRRTLSFDVPPGRYEVRLRRVDLKNEGTRVGHEVVWEGLRGYLDEEVTFQGLTLIAIKIRATNNLNDKSNLSFNVICTRKLQTWGTAGFSTEYFPTRSIIWALVDVFRNNAYGARIISDVFYDWDTLLDLEALYVERGDTFDWIFRDSITVWETAKTIARAGRATPLLVGSRISMRRDGPLEIPVSMFTPDNIVGGSFQWDVQLWELNENDSIRIEYTEESTGYKQETVLCSLPGETTDNPSDVRLAGVQSREQAYHEGMFILASQRYLRDQVTFDTGMEGHIPTFGDLIIVSHDVPRWGQSGIVVNAFAESSGDFRIWVSEPLIWTDSDGEHQIQFRSREGAVLGPYTAIQQEDPMQVVFNMGESANEDFDFLLSGKTEPMMFLFGVAGRIAQRCKVRKVEPQGGEIVRIVAVSDDARIHSFDELVPPGLGQSPFPIQAPDLPIISHLYLSQMGGTALIVQASWTAAYGAQYYIVQISTDGVNWSESFETFTTSIQLQVLPGDVWVRVAGVNNGQGPWIMGQIPIGFIDLDILLPWVALEWAVRWAGVSGVTGFEVDVYDASESSPVLKHTETLGSSLREFHYDYEQALLDDNVTRHMLVRVNPILVDGPSDHPDELELTNAIPGVCTGLGSEQVSFDSDGLSYRLFWSVPHEDDLIRIKVWVSSEEFFDPSLIDPYLEVEGSSIGWADLPEEVFVTSPIGSSGQPDILYWRVAVFDVWGNEISTNLSEQQELVILPELYNSQAGLLAQGFEAPDYDQVQAIDEALYAILYGTATAEQIELATPTNEILGEMLS